MKQHPICKSCGKPMRRSHQNRGNFHGQKCAAAYGEAAASNVVARIFIGRPAQPVTLVRTSKTKAVQA